MSKPGAETTITEGGTKLSQGKVVIVIATAATMIVAWYSFSGPANGLNAPAIAVTSAEQGTIETLRQIASVSFETNENGNIVQLSATGPDVGDAELAGISKLSRLQKLTLNESRVTNESLKVIGELTDLKTLLLEKTAITAEGLESLTSLKSLEHVSLAGCSLGDDGAAAIGRMTSLLFLDLRQSDISDAGLRSLTGLNRLQRLYLNGTNVSGEGLSEWGSHPSLQLLNLSGVGLTKDTIRNLAGFPELGQLYLDGVSIDDEFLSTLVDTVVTSLPKLEFLSLADTNISDSSVEMMKRLSTAKELFNVSLTGTPLSLEAYRVLAAATSNISYSVDYN